MRALRDFNWPKIKVEDRLIFLGLINDLFPGIQADAKTDEQMKEDCSTVARSKNLQSEEGFVLKCV
jgi:dynein heavy chain